MSGLRRFLVTFLYVCFVLVLPYLALGFCHFYGVYTSLILFCSVIVDTRGDSGDTKPTATIAPSAAAKAKPASKKPAPAPVPPPPVAALPAPMPAVPNPVLASTTATTSAVPPPVPPQPAPLPPPAVAVAPPAQMASAPMEATSTSIIPSAPAPSSSSPQFLAQLNNSLTQFWKEQLAVVHEYSNQTEQDFKTHNDLPLARIKRIMKSDEDVRMISAEAPVLFAKACELFILDLSIRSWNYSQLHKRRTLQKEDIKEAIQKTDIFDFLVDVI